MKDNLDAFEHLARRAHPGADAAGVHAGRMMRGVLQIMRNGAGRRHSKDNDDDDQQGPGCCSKERGGHFFLSQPQKRLHPTPNLTGWSTDRRAPVLPAPLPDDALDPFILAAQLQVFAILGERLDGIFLV